VSLNELSPDRMPVIDRVSEVPMEIYKDVYFEKLLESYSNEALHDVTMQIINGIGYDFDAISIEDKYLLGKACAVSSRLELSAEDEPGLIRAFTIVRGARPMVGLKRALEKIGVLDENAIVSSYNAVVEVLENLPKDKPVSIKQLTYIDDRITSRVELLSDEQITKEQRNVLIEKKSIKKYIQEVIEGARYSPERVNPTTGGVAYLEKFALETMTLPSDYVGEKGLARDKTIELIEDATEYGNSRYAEDIYYRCIHFLDGGEPIYPGIVPIIKEATKKPQFANELLLVVFDNSGIEDSAPWLSELVREIKPRNQEGCDFVESDTFYTIPKWAVGKGKEYTDSDEVFASNGVVAFKEDFDGYGGFDETEVQKLKELFDNVNKDSYYQLHFIPHDNTEYAGDNNAFSIIEMGLSGIRGLVSFFEDKNVYTNTALVGSTNPRMAQLATRLGFIAAGYSNEQLKKLVKTEKGNEESVMVVSTVGRLIEQMRTEKSKKLIARYSR